MITTVSTKGQIVLPSELRQEDRIKPGEQFEVRRLDAGEYLLKRKAPPCNAGLVDWLLSCPHKGCLEPMKFPDTTDHIAVDL
ncbi:MAG: AbrB/MazE/SpoVT family DNA-binding domain-containing protein [Candidatus Sumerlaeaceae bacterium]